KIIYSCSGAADVGEIADKAARELRKENFAQGSCIAAVGAGLEGFIQSAKGADINIALDGCSVACSRRILENIGVEPVSYVVTDMGFTKGRTDISSETIDAVCGAVRKGTAVKSGTPAGSAEGSGCGCGGKC
ncbi:MAG: putative zinc-binding protein, partial [Spirochaetota bacterium]